MSDTDSPLFGDNKVPQLVELKKQLDALEGIVIPFQLHVPIRELTEKLEDAGY